MCNLWWNVPAMLARHSRRRTWALRSVRFPVYWFSFDLQLWPSQWEQEALHLRKWSGKREGLCFTAQLVTSRAKSKKGVWKERRRGREKLEKEWEREKTFSSSHPFLSSGSADAHAKRIAPDVMSKCRAFTDPRTGIWEILENIYLRVHLSQLTQVNTNTQYECISHGFANLLQAWLLALFWNATLHTPRPREPTIF